jgi:cytochrome c-type biogenesis protein CcmE
VANRNRWWKVLGVASVVGVVATGALVAQDERQRRAYTPDEVRDRLRERMESADAADDGTDTADA